MRSIKLALVDNDCVVRAETDLALKGKGDRIGSFLKEINEELIPGKTAHLEIEGFETGPVTFEISKFR